MNPHDEEVLGRAYDARLMRRLLTYIRPYRMMVFFSVCLIFVVAALDLAGPYLTAIAIDHYIGLGRLDGLHQVGLLYIAALLCQFAVTYLQTYLMNLTGQRIMYDLRMEIFAHLQRLQVSFFDRNPVGRLMTRVTTDVDVLNELFTSGVVAVFGDIFTLFGIIVVMFWLNFKLALVTMSVVPILFLVSWAFKIKVRASYRRVRTAIARINAFLQENIVGMSVVQLFVQEQRRLGQFRERNEEHRQANLQSILYYAVFYPVISLIGAVAIALIIWYGGNQVVSGVLTMGALVAFIQYSERFYKPISDLSEKFNILQGAMASSERIFKLLDTPVTISSSSDPSRVEAVEGRIEFDHVWFSYKEKEPVLRDVSFRVEPGESVALVGATGSGKSTIINLLTRFYDVTAGGVCVDGVDVRRWDLQQLRRNVGVVLQDVFLFSGSVEDNIHLGRALPNEKVVAAARLVNADRFIERLPRDYASRVTERGSSFSVGERQLLAFARALAYDPRILVLDEATSSVDTETELLIRDALATLMKGRTSIIVAHRLSTIQNCDRILVLHKGEIREAGNHQQLIQQRGLYYKLYQLQYKDQLSGIADCRLPIAD